MYIETFPSKMKYARKRAGFSQKEVAEETGIPRSTITKYETGKLEPTIERLGILADFYGVDLNWLVGTSGQNPLLRPNKDRDIITDKMAGVEKRRDD